MATGNSTTGSAANLTAAMAARLARVPGTTTVDRMFDSDDEDLIDYSDHEEDYYTSSQSRVAGSTGLPTGSAITIPAADVAGLKVSGAGMSVSVYTGTAMDSSVTVATATVATAATATTAVSSADKYPELADFDFDVNIDIDASADAGAEAEVDATVSGFDIYDEPSQGHQTQSNTGGATDMIDYTLFDDDDELNRHHDGQDRQPTESRHSMAESRHSVAESRHSMAESGNNPDHDGLIGHASLGPAGGRPEPAVHPAVPAVHAHDVDEIDYDDDDYQDQHPADEGDEADFGPIDLGPFDDDDDATNGKPDALSTVDALDAFDAEEPHQPEHASPALAVESAVAAAHPYSQVETEEPDQDRHDHHPQEHPRHPAYGQEDEITYDEDDYEEPHPNPSARNEAENTADHSRRPASFGSSVLQPSVGLDHTVGSANGNTVGSTVDSAVDNTDDSTDDSGFDNTLDNTLDTILDEAIDHTLDIVMEEARTRGLTQAADADPDWPHITVSYKSDEYPMFASAHNQDKMSFFSDLSVLHFSIDRLLAALRNELSEEITTDDELVLQINELGLEYSESTRTDYLNLVTLHQLLDVYRQLVENQGLDRSRAMSAFLSVRPTLSSRLDLIVESAHSGEPLDAIARYFPAPPSETVKPGGATHAQQQQEEDLDDPAHTLAAGHPTREPGHHVSPGAESVHRSNVVIKEEEPQPQQPDDGNTRDPPQPCYSPHFCVCAKCVHSFNLAEEMRYGQSARSRSQAAPPSSSPSPQQAPAPASSPRTAELDSGPAHAPAPAHYRLDANGTISAAHDDRDDRDGRDGEPQTDFDWSADPGHPEPGHPDHGDARESVDLPEAHVSPVAGEQTSGSSTVIGDDLCTPSQPRPATSFSFLFDDEKEIDWREDGDSDSAEDEPQPEPAPPGPKPSPQGSKRPREEEEEEDELLDLEDGQDVKRRRAIDPADPSARY